MVTVKQVKDLGFEFVEGDMITIGGVDKYVAVDAKYSDYIAMNSMPSTAVVKEFCYRWHNFNDMPCNGELRVDALSKTKAFEGVMASELDWTDRVSERIARWRPSMKNWESEEIPTETPEEKEALDQLSIIPELRNLEFTDSQAKIAAAIKTLESLGYTWNGGEQWKPPLGEKPKWLETEVTYEKVEGSIFDLESDYENGLLHSKHKEKEKEKYYQINTHIWLASSLAKNNLYRKVEKEIDWFSVLDKRLDEAPYIFDGSISKSDDGDLIRVNGTFRVDLFPEMCHLVAEYTPKPTKQCD